VVGETITKLRMVENEEETAETEEDAEVEEEVPILLEVEVADKIQQEERICGLRKGMVNTTRAMVDEEGEAAIVEIEVSEVEDPPQGITMAGEAEV